MKRQHWIIVPEGMPILATALILTVLVALISTWQLAIIPGIFLLFTVYFFRNPERRAEVQDNEVLSPADGVVLGVQEVQEDRYLHAPAIKVSIFLSIFNVHVNRSPIKGTVQFVQYQPGQFLPAFKGHASEINERNYVGLRNEEHPEWNLMVVQVTGFIARRIVCWAKVGEQLLQGQRFGLIKFGSCTEVYLPAGSEILVSRGQKVRGGQTIIGRLDHV